MISRSSITCTIFSTILFVSCNTGRYAAETDDLKHLLEKEHSMSLPADKRYFILIPSNQCPKCIGIDGSKFKDEFVDRITVISSIDAVNFRHLKHVFYDTNDQVIKLQFIDYNPKIVVTEKSRIVAVIGVNPELSQLDSLYRAEY